MPTSEERIVQDFREKSSTNQIDPLWFHSWFQAATLEPFKAVDFLMSEIVQKERCIGCAACVQICPVNVFDYVGDKPIDTRHDGCVFCSLCAAVCPPAHLGSADLAKFIMRDDDCKDEGFGRYKTAILARSRLDNVLSVAQDGGIASSILIEALDSGLIDGVVLGDSVAGEPLSPVPKLATTKEEILHCAGSRYTYSPNTIALREAFDKNLRIAVVGVPCQINGLRHIQYGPSEGFQFAEWFRKNIIFSIGLFCSEVFTNEGLINLSKTINVRMEDIESINVKGKVITKTKDGRTVVSSLKNMRKSMRSACNYCWDYSADLADVSLGGIGQDGWTFTVIRTSIGQELYSKLIEKGSIETKELGSDQQPSSAKELLMKLSAQKRNRPKSYAK